jgi:hypothetical protein
MSRKLKDAMDRGLSGVDFDTRLSNGEMRRIEKTEGEGNIMKRKMAVSLVSAFILILILAAGADAAAYLSGNVEIDWFGNVVEFSEPEDFSTPVPTRAVKSVRLDSKSVEELFSGKPKDEVWIIDYSNSENEMQSITEKVVGLDDLKKRISEAGLPFLVPDPPAGYAFKDIQVEFFVDEQALKNITYSRTETPYEHITLRRIRTGEDIKRNIKCYYICFEDANGNQISVLAQFSNTMTEYGFGAREGDIYEPVSVPGMEKALYIKSTGNSESLYLFQTGFEPIEYDELYDIDSPNYQWGENTRICDAVFYTIHSKTAQNDVLLSIANSLK